MRWRSILAALFFVGLWPATAPAAPVGKDAPAGKDARARELFQQGDAAYAKGRYEQALFAFQEAYDLSGRPQLLFNISNTLERLGRYSEALDALEKYVASGKAKDRDVVDERLANLRKRVLQQKKSEKEEEERKKAAEAPPPKPAEPAKETPPNVSKDPVIGPEKSTPVLPIVVLGLAGVSLATAGVFGALTLTARKDVDAGCKDGPHGPLCLGGARSALDRDYTFGIVTDVAAASGVVLAGVGLYLLFTHKDAEPYVYVGKRVVVRPTGPGMELVGAF